MEREEYIQHYRNLIGDENNTMVTDNSAFKLGRRHYHSGELGRPPQDDEWWFLPEDQQITDYQKHCDLANRWQLALKNERENGNGNC